ncbi:S8 family serine peptidase [Lentzea sp. BCCO 10_0798]|uniref:S8 family serine peptidase n=1 Tax=Lentzea kristufekii TaxID=3095430 RepID=A0ABU4U0X8_9PSEU|nr:S8 family serine peptidase [Lentzea sp. BCCO 10_0798]MDX8054060.1 S8 family serine peptidase [Lentzea sp. BCCO 10_0798]
MRLARCLVITALAAGLLSPATTAQAEPSRAQRTSTITLISGDKVVVTERGELVRVEGRPGVQFAQYVQNDHQYVVPADAIDAVGQDRVDKRFFDITSLHAYGYTDDKIDRIPLLNNGFRAAGAVPKKDAAQQWTARRTSALRAEKLWLDGKSQISLTESVPMVGAPAAWQAGFDGTGVTVAVLDTGYDRNHPELAGVVSVSKDFTPSGIQDDIGHGTHVAATIAGRGSRYVGVAKGASLAVGRVCEASYCFDSAVIAGMEWAAREVRAEVVNMSLGGDQSDGSDPLSRKVEELTAETGALFVVAAGNSGTFRKVSSPAVADSALAVANLTKQGAVEEMSSRGPRLGDHAVKPDIAAPGTDIVAARAENTLWEHVVDDLHARLTGTSMAAPHVAGAAAVLAQRNPSWTAAELKAHLMATVKPVADSPTSVGTGLLDVGRAVTQQVRASTGSLSFGLLEWPHTRTFTKTITYSNAAADPVSLTLRHDLGADFSVPSSVTVPARGSVAVDVVLDPRKGNGTFFGHVKASGAGVELTTSVGAYVQEERHALTLSMIGRDGKPVPDEFAVVVNMTTKEASVLSIGLDGTGSARLPVADYAVLSRIDERTPNYDWFAPIAATEVAGRVSLAADVSVTLDARQGKQIGVELPERDSVVWYRDAQLRVPFAPGKISGVASIIDGRVPLYGLSFGAPLPELTYDSGLKGGQPLVSVPGGFPVRYYESSKYLPPGEHRLDVAERGSDVRGKLALVRTAGEDVYPVAQAMKDAGAVAVLWAGPVPFGYEEQTAIPVIAAAEHHVAVTPATLTLRAIAGSPVSYTLFLQHKGSLPFGVKKFRHSELAQVKARYHTSGGDGSVNQRNNPVVNGAIGVTLDERLAAPVERTEYFTPGTWFQEGFDGRASGAGDDPMTTSWAHVDPVTFQPGGRYERTNLRAVTSPRLGGASLVPWADGGGVERAGDLITTRISPFGGSGWVENWRQTGGGYVELFRDGTSLGFSDVRRGSFHAPARDGRYELVLDASRDSLALSTNVKTSWEFSASADGKLPLLEVGYSVPLDLRNSWKAGVPMPVKFTATRQAGKATVRSLQAYASFDDGVTWAPVKSIVPPGGKAGGFVSLRVVAADADGNTVDQTVLRAYRLR